MPFNQGTTCKTRDEKMTIRFQPCQLRTVHVKTHQNNNQHLPHLQLTLKLLFCTSIRFSPLRYTTCCESRPSHHRLMTQKCRNCNTIFIFLNKDIRQRKEICFSWPLTSCCMAPRESRALEQWKRNCKMKRVR